MTPADKLLDREAVREAVAATYRAAGLERRHGAAPVAPLRSLIAAYPLTWYEVRNLTEASSAAFLHQTFGVPRDAVTASDDALAGRLYATAVGGCILVEQTHRLVRRRFTVAHELGHYVLHVLPRLAAGAAAFTETLLRTRGAPDDDGPSDGRSVVIGEYSHALQIDAAQAEREADLFAAELLMPEPLCRSLVETHYRRCGGKEAVLARFLATECLVSDRAMTRRLAELNLLGGVA